MSVLGESKRFRFTVKKKENGAVVVVKGVRNNNFELKQRNTQIF